VFRLFKKGSTGREVLGGVWINGDEVRGEANEESGVVLVYYWGNIGIESSFPLVCFLFPFYNLGTAYLDRRWDPFV
jgi:hypothetical protein